MEKLKKEPLVSVLILTYNRTDLLKKCLDSCLRSSYSNLEFIIVDNNSDEDVISFMKENYKNKKIKTYRNKVNSGLTGGFNFGYKFCNGKYVMLLCNDTTVGKEAIKELVKFAQQDSEIGIVAPLVTQMKYPDLVHSAGSFLTHTGLLYHYGVYKNKNLSIYKKPYYIFSATGAAFLVRKEATDKTGLYSEDFFMAYDESDLCHRVWLGGYTIVYCPKAEVKHLWSATVSTTASPKVWFWNERNLLSSFMMNFSFPGVIYFLSMVNLALIFWSFTWIRQGNWGMVINLPKAYWWHINNLDQTLKRRDNIQKKVRRVSDDQIFKKVIVNPSWRYYLMHLGYKFKDSSLPKRVLYLGNV